MSEANAVVPGTTVVIPGLIDPLAFIQLHGDNTITVISKHMEMGQGIHTGLATLVAEELDADRAQIRVKAAPVGNPAYGNPLIGGGQGTGGQTATQASYLTMRNAGAAMRAMLVAAAAKRWAVPVASISVNAGVVSVGDAQRATFGELAADAMLMPVPIAVTLKDPAQFVYIGKQFARLDSPDKIRGKAVFTHDLKLPGMLVAVIARPNRAGEKVASFDATRALAFPGVLHVVQTDAGIAVVAENFWTALQGREQLSIQWDTTAAFRKSSTDIYGELRALVDTQGKVFAENGDVDAALAGAATRIQSYTQVPYLTHAPMETMAIIIQLKAGALTAWGGMQLASMDQYLLATAAGITPDKVSLNMQITGGSFGRRAMPHSLPGIEALGIIRALDTDQPIKLMYDRPDDMAGPHNYYRPGFVHRIDAGLDADGNLVAWRHRSAGQSMLIGTLMEAAMVHDGIDWMSVEGAQDQAYQIPHMRMELHTPTYPIRASWMRTSGVLHNAFAIETAMDELAVKAGKNPLDFRLKLLPEGSREQGCLMLVAEKADWYTPLAGSPNGGRRGRGIAVAPGHRSYAAVVIEVTVGASGTDYRIDRVVAVIDCGTVVNPDNVLSQIEGQVGFALSMCRYGQISFIDGAVDQQFFSDYHVTRMHTMPKVERYIVASTQGPSGAAETVACVVGAALANALAMAAGEPQRTMPLTLPGAMTERWDVPAELNTFDGATGWSPPQGWVPISSRP